MWQGKAYGKRTHVVRTCMWQGNALSGSMHMAGKMQVWQVKAPCGMQVAKRCDHEAKEGPSVKQMVWQERIKETAKWNNCAKEKSQLCLFFFKKKERETNTIVPFKILCTTFIPINFLPCLPHNLLINVREIVSTLW